MRFATFGLLAAGAAAYLAATQGVADAMTFTVAALALAAFVAARLGARPSSRRPDQLVAPARNRAVEEQVSTLAANLTALADARSGFTPELASRETLSLYLVGTGRNKIAVIKVLRQFRQLGLKEAKDLADASSGSERVLLASDLTTARAREFAEELQRAGATIEFG
ncbi:MAG: ribosomal protein L7/L12 [Dehalococcoidia bacterium]